MELTKENIEATIHRFMEGETTNAEEQALYRFFHSNDIPEHLKPYQPMFAWYEQGMPEENSAKPRVQKRSFRLSPRMLWGTGIAATLVLLIGFGWQTNQQQADEWACYEGSYVKVNGKYITEVTEIIPIILETLAQAEEIENSIQKQMDKIACVEEEIREKEEMVNF